MMYEETCQLGFRDPTYYDKFYNAGNDYSA